MDKGVSGGAFSIKQWDGAHPVHRLISNQIPRRFLTGGVPTRPSRVDMYQLQFRSVAKAKGAVFRTINAPISAPLVFP